MSDLSETELRKKKNKREFIFTLLMLFVISALSAAFVLTFRFKMKQFQIAPEQTEQPDESKSRNQPQDSVHPKPHSFLLQNSSQGTLIASLQKF